MLSSSTSKIVGILLFNGMNSRDGLKVIIQDLAFGWLQHYFIATILVRVVEEQFPCCPTHFQFSFSLICQHNWHNELMHFLVIFSSLRSEIRSHLLLAYLCTFFLSVLYWVILFSYLKSLEYLRAYSLDLFCICTCSLGDHIVPMAFPWVLVLHIKLIGILYWTCPISNCLFSICPPPTPKKKVLSSPQCLSSQ